MQTYTYEISIKSSLNYPLIFSTIIPPIKESKKEIIEKDEKKHYTTFIKDHWENYML